MPLNVKPSTLAELLPEKIERMSDEECAILFAQLRWPETDGKPMCPKCGSIGAYDVSRGARYRSLRCKNNSCRHDFSATSGTIFDHRKAPLRYYLLAIAMQAVCRRKKINGLELSRRTGCQYKTAYDLAHRAAVFFRAGMEARI